MSDQVKGATESVTEAADESPVETKVYRPCYVQAHELVEYLLIEQCSGDAVSTVRQCLAASTSGGYLTLTGEFGETMRAFFAEQRKLALVRAIRALVLAEQANERAGELEDLVYKLRTECNYNFVEVIRAMALN